MVIDCWCGRVHSFQRRGGRIIEGHNSFNLANRSHIQRSERWGK